jgi:haloacetate dehalogenase
VVGRRRAEHAGSGAVMATVNMLFEGFSTHRIPTDDAELFVRMGGHGPPLVLVHGYPQTHVCWSRVAAALAERFTLVLCDLRGYGDSIGPAPDTDASNYAKRVMAADLVSVMDSLGFRQFRVAAHDRGARVAYRLALDSPERVERLAVLSILPTFAMWERLSDPAYAMRAFHWYFLAQPPSLPQQLIERNAHRYVRATLAGCTAGADLSSFLPEALDAYEAANAKSSVIAAGCADYRAGWTTDRLHDDADLAAGHKISCPVLALRGPTNFPIRRRCLPHGAESRRGSTDRRSTAALSARGSARRRRGGAPAVLRELKRPPQCAASAARFSSGSTALGKRVSKSMSFAHSGTIVMRTICS